MSKTENKTPATLPIATPVYRGKCAPFLNPVREICTGAGMTAKGIAAALKISEDMVRDTIDAIRRTEGAPILDETGARVGHTGRTVIMPNVSGTFVYKGLDGKGYKAPAK